MLEPVLSLLFAIIENMCHKHHLTVPAIFILLKNINIHFIENLQQTGHYPSSSTLTAVPPTGEKGCVSTKAELTAECR